jgi:hypothetical protein
LDTPNFLFFEMFHQRRLFLLSASISQGNMPCNGTRISIQRNTTFSLFSVSRLCLCTCPIKLTITNDRLVGGNTMSQQGGHGSHFGGSITPMMAGSSSTSALCYTGLDIAMESSTADCVKRIGVYGTEKGQEKHTCATRTIAIEPRRKRQTTAALLPMKRRP